MSALRRLAQALPGIALLAGAIAGCPGQDRAIAPRGSLSGDRVGRVTSNGLTHNGILQDLASVPLTDAGLDSLGYIDDLATDPGIVKFFEYMIECSLRADQQVTIGQGADAVTLVGSAGLAPEWADGPCEEACQEWVSACLFARTNTYGIPVAIYMTGPSPALLGDPDAKPPPEFEFEEGAFYGNLFLDPPREHSCRGRNRDPFFATVRVCAQPGNRCGMQHVGPCGEIDGLTGEPAERHACEGFESGGYVRCHNRASLAGSSAFPDGSRTYERVITVLLPKSALHAGAASTCESKPLAVPPPAETPGPAGAHCNNDDDCRTDVGLLCDARHPYGMCTNACTSSGDPALEAAQCGEGGTCLQRITDAICTAPCTPAVIGGDCERGRVCTNFALFASMPDDPGCAPWCSDDSDCGAENHCDRFGSCVERPVDTTLLADGEPCTFPPGSDTPVVLCRGTCIRPGQNQAEGLCASLINIGVTKQCPDHPPEVMVPYVIDGDDLAVCAYRNCTTSEDCTAPLKCLATAVGKRCSYQ